jgi:hypothetical protein
MQTMLKYVYSVKTELNVRDTMTVYSCKV